MADFGKIQSNAGYEARDIGQVSPLHARRNGDGRKETLRTCDLMRAKDRYLYIWSPQNNFWSHHSTNWMGTVPAQREVFQKMGISTMVCSKYLGQRYVMVYK